ncbi:MAG: type II/IV secretion system protein [Candidatus Levybacteria bacterium]|nr:type II/IV secretion system protein [Candidatus Levybacteria bacterium]
MVLPNEQVNDLLTKVGVDQKTLNDLIIFTDNAKISLQEAAIEKNVITDEKLGMLIAASLKMPFISLSKVSIPEPVFRIIPERIARKYKVLAFGRDGTGIKLAMANPKETQLQEMVIKKTGQKIVPYYATERDIENSMQLYKKNLQELFDDLLQTEVPTKTTSDDAPIVKMIEILVTRAYQDKASDIHIEPQEKNIIIRFRIDGILHDVLSLEKRHHDRIVTRIKILSKLRTDEHLSPQDGKMRMQVDDENLDIRTSIIPIADGEKVVLRLLSSHFRQFSLQDLGMSDTDLKKINNAINKSYGMILSTGPTGSGKTTLIYSILKILNTRQKNITTIEDPVEYRIKAVNQIQVNTKTKLTFANGLRSILRQDPDIIFVGEIRDSETAGIAVNAALTGHLVLSTIHTTNAATALPRLIDMEIEPFLVASTVDIIVAQRLVRRICESCKIKALAKRSDLLKNFPEKSITKYFGSQDNIKVMQGQGCKMCHYTGFSGRIGIFEVIDVSNTVRKLITQKSDSDVINKAAIEEGMTTMLEDGLEKVAKGVTTISEVLRVTKVESA